MCQSIPIIGGFIRGVGAVGRELGTIGRGLSQYGQNYLIYSGAFLPEPEFRRHEMYARSPVLLTTSDGVSLWCYLLTQTKEVDHAWLQIPVKHKMSNDEFAATRPTVLMFHGNGDKYGHIELAHIFYAMRCNVFMLSYRGYGRSEGIPSESGLCIDAQTALDYILSHPILQSTPVILYGHSLGGAVAIHLASQNPSKIRALILENTFTDLRRVIVHVFPILYPFISLCHEKWDSASKLPLIPLETPILMLSGESDKLVPPRHMDKLWEIASKRQGTMVDGGSGNGSTQAESGEQNADRGDDRSKLVKVPYGRHNTTFMQLYNWSVVTEFVASMCT
ncbi:Alpha/Beta hydrolase protein [Pisolithus marmoratus]|nr:Alpha/Beta hydrolase protein [Pisolithus marmoratus]